MEAQFSIQRTNSGLSSGDVALALTEPIFATLLCPVLYIIRVWRNESIPSVAALSPARYQLEADGKQTKPTMLQHFRLIDLCAFGLELSAHRSSRFYLFGRRSDTLIGV